MNLNKNLLWWLTHHYPIHLESNPDPIAMSELLRKGLIVEKRDWITNKPIYYRTEKGEKVNARQRS